MSHQHWSASSPDWHPATLSSDVLESWNIYGKTNIHTNDNFYILCNYIEKNLKEKIKKVTNIQYFSATEIEFRLCFFRFKSYKMKDSM